MDFSRYILTVNSHRFGGIETFMRDHAKVLVRAGGEPPLLLASYVAPHSDTAVYSAVEVCPAEEIEGIVDWSLDAGTLRDICRPSLVWAHNAHLAHAWCLCARAGIPMLPTFHSAVGNVGRPENEAEWLGITLALHRLPFVSAVSDEIARSLVALRHDLDVRLIPNRVLQASVGTLKSVRPPLNGAPVKMIMATRREKLGHIRAAIDFLVAWRQNIGPASLAIIGGGQPGMNVGNPFLEAARFLGRKWLAAKPSRIAALKCVEFEQPINQISERIEEATIVLGMGRAALEGLAAGKPVILVGYSDVVDQIDNSNFNELAATNFSGRGVPNRPVGQVVAKAAEYISHGYEPDRRLIERVSLEAAWPSVRAILDEAASAPPNEEDQKLVEAINTIIENSSPHRYLESIAEVLKPWERKTLAALATAGKKIAS